MAFFYQTILCPVDFDENSLIALAKAIEIAQRFGSSVILMHVVPMVYSLGEVPPPITMYEDQENAARAKLLEIAKRKLEGLKYEVHVYSGDVIATILAAQKKYQPDLLVMAIHGRHGLAHMFVGSVAEAVVRKATCPVLTIREEVPGAPRDAKKGAKKGALPDRPE